MMKSTRNMIIFFFLALLISPITLLANYNPQTGRFLQRDPIGIRDEICLVDFASIGYPYYIGPFINMESQYQDSMNLYEYVKSKPTILIDPKGLQQSSSVYNPSQVKSENCEWKVDSSEYLGFYGWWMGLLVQEIAAPGKCTYLGIDIYRVTEGCYKEGSDIPQKVDVYYEKIPSTKTIENPFGTKFCLCPLRALLHAKPSMNREV